MAEANTGDVAIFSSRYAESEGSAVSCAVCLSPLVRDAADEHGARTATVRTACGHEFHLVCLVRCMEVRGASCPMCRQNVDTELAAAPRPWMLGARSPRERPRHGFGSLLRNAQAGSSPFRAAQDLHASDTAVAVEVAESVRRSLAEEDARSSSASGLHVLSDVRRHRSGSNAMRGGSWRRLAADGSTTEPPWYPEIAEAVARSLADETARRVQTESTIQRPHVPSRFHHGGPDRSTAVAVAAAAAAAAAVAAAAVAQEESNSNLGDVVDPSVLAGLADAVGRIHEAGLLNSASQDGQAPAARRGQDSEAGDVRSQSASAWLRSTGNHLGGMRSRSGSAWLRYAGLRSASSAPYTDGEEPGAARQVEAASGTRGGSWPPSARGGELRGEPVTSLEGHAEDEALSTEEGC